MKLKSANGKYLLAASQNRGDLKIFELNKSVKTLDLDPQDVKATIKYKNGKTSTQEFYYGSSFLSQSGRFLLLNGQVSEVEIMNSKGITRKVNL